MYKDRYKRNCFLYDINGRKRPGNITKHIPISVSRNKPTLNDAENRRRVVQEIKQRCEKGEELDSIVSEIAERVEIKEQFDYFIKNGITDFNQIFKNWYQSYEKNKEKIITINEVR